MAKKKTIKKTIKASLKVLGKTFKAEGKTVEEVVSKLNPSLARGVGILVLDKGDLHKERILQPNTVNNVFGQRSPTMKSIAMKSIIILFDEFDK